MDKNKLACIVFDKANVSRRKKKHNTFDKQLLILDNEENRIVLNITDGIQYTEEESSIVSLTTESNATILFSLNKYAIDLKMPEVVSIKFYKYCSLFNNYNGMLLDTNFFFEFSLVDGNKIYVDYANNKVIQTIDLEIKSYKFSEIETIYETGKKNYFKGLNLSFKEYIAVKYKLHLYDKEIRKLIKNN